MQFEPAKSVERNDRIIVVGFPAHETRSIRIGAHGTSLTRRALWTTQLGDRLTDCSPNGVSVTVTGLTGANSSQGLQAITAARVNGFDVVLIEYAINDADLLDGIALSESLTNHRHMISWLRKANPGISIILLATNPVRGIQKLKRPQLETYYTALADLADEESVSYFDGTSRWTGRYLTSQSLPDGLHPDPKVEAELYSRPLARMVAGSLGLSCRI